MFSIIEKAWLSLKKNFPPHLGTRIHIFPLGISCCCWLTKLLLWNRKPTEKQLEQLRTRITLVVVGVRWERGVDRTLTCPTTRGRISSPRAALTIITLVTGAVQQKKRHSFALQMWRFSIQIRILIRKRNYASTASFHSSAKLGYFQTCRFVAACNKCYCIKWFCCLPQ